MIMRKMLLKIITLAFCIIAGIFVIYPILGLEEILLKRKSNKAIPHCKILEFPPVKTERLKEEKRLKMFPLHPSQTCPNNLVSVDSGKQLKTIMFGYASLWSFARKKKLFPVISDAMKDKLQHYFQNLTIPSLYEMKKVGLCAKDSMNLTTLNTNPMTEEY